MKTKSEYRFEILNLESKIQMVEEQIDDIYLFEDPDSQGSELRDLSNLLKDLNSDLDDLMDEYEEKAIRCGWSSI